MLHNVRQRIPELLPPSQQSHMLLSHRALPGVFSEHICHHPASLSHQEREDPRCRLPSCCCVLEG